MDIKVTDDLKSFINSGWILAYRECSLFSRNISKHWFEFNDCHAIIESCFQEDYTEFSVESQRYVTKNVLEEKHFVKVSLVVSCSNITGFESTYRLVCSRASVCDDFWSSTDCLHGDIYFDFSGH
ncbi:hypothetical protein TNCV_1115211 [Trichonephila clavipes]|nr:hypothetical protein TNCV_1115211 [Trichonephila clavipes]